MPNLERSTLAYAYASEPARALDPVPRAAEKQASREADARALASGEKTRAQLVAENSFLPLHAVGNIDFSSVPLAR
jgi:hypothetical protein